MLADASKAGEIAQRLLNPEAFSHEVTDLKLLETHISWVILTGSFAYKIKKPVKFDFVDYTALESRRRFCLREVELNRRFAPELYLDVVPIFERGGRLVVGAHSIDESGLEPTDQPLDYAVRMREFSQDAIVAARINSPELSSDSVEQFGKYIAEFHESIDSLPPASVRCDSDGIGQDTLDNFTYLTNVFREDRRFETVMQLEEWSANQFAKLTPKFDTRRDAQKIRCCHGDLHLKNIVQLDGELVPFDGIEFNEQFQWIDVLSEIAFPVVDFVARGRPELAWRLANSYLESTDDYGNLDLLKFYVVYRAMVRAKVTWLNPLNHTDAVRKKYSGEGKQLDKFAGPWDKYFGAACYFAFEVKPKLTITHGFSGSGKSTSALKLIEQEGGIRIRSDVERAKMVDDQCIDEKYSSETTQRVYLYLLELANSGIKANMPMVIDATFLEFTRRSQFALLAKKHDVEFQILSCDAPFEELCRRIQCRDKDPSEATIQVLENQMKTHEPLTTDELQFVRKFV